MNRNLILSTFWLALAFAAQAHAAPAGGAACGRACLGGLLDRYLAALVSPSK